MVITGYQKFTLNNPTRLLLLPTNHTYAHYASNFDASNEGTQDLKGLCTVHIKFFKSNRRNVFIIE